MKAIEYSGLFNSYQFVAEGEKIVDYALRESAERVRIGDIYLAKVVELQTPFCFVEIDDGARLFVRRRDLASTLNSLNPKLNDVVYVQVDAEPVAQKWGRATGRIELPSANMVLVTDCSGLHISRQIDGALRRNYRAALSGLIDARFGVILRTSAQKSTMDALKSELQALIKRFETIFVRPTERNYKRLRHRSNIDLFTKYSSQLTSCCGYDRKLSGALAFSKMKTLRHHFDLMTWLKNSSKVNIETEQGVQLVVQQVEAMTVVDINAKALKVDLAERSFNYAVNYYGVEALIDVIAARKLSGKVIVDCLTMNKSERGKFTAAVKTALRLANIHYKGMTASGLLELSIDRGETSLFEQFYARADMGYFIKPTVALDYWLDVAAYRAQTTGQGIYYLAVSPDIYYLLKRSQAQLSEYLQRHHVTLHCALYEGLSGYIAPLKCGLTDDYQKIKFEVFR